MEKLLIGNIKDFQGVLNVLLEKNLTATLPQNNLQELQYHNRYFFHHN